MQQLARPVVPLEEAEHDPSGVFQSGFVRCRQLDPRLLALSFASALFTGCRSCLLGDSWVPGTAGTVADAEHHFIGNRLGFGASMGNVILFISISEPERARHISHSGFFVVTL